MLKTPQTLRLHLGIFGRTNVGKSTLLNLITGQETAVTSPHPGTTTDAVIKSMELLPLGPVLLLDTAGLDDASVLGDARIQATEKTFNRTDVAVLVLEAPTWTDYEEEIVNRCRRAGIPCLAVIGKIDLGAPSPEYLEVVRAKTADVLEVSALETASRCAFLDRFKAAVLQLCPEDFLAPPPLLGDLLEEKKTCILIVPIDLEAPRGRIILPQVQAIRDLLDHDQAALVVKEDGYRACLENLRTPPGLVVCDSQVVERMVAETPGSVPCTTFSILLARRIGDLAGAVRATREIDRLRDKDRILIAEACTHHPLEDDIGRVKIPRWLRQYTGRDLEIETRPGRNFPDDLGRYRLIIHCGGCMISRREMLLRLREAAAAGVPVTNYGVCISYLRGVLGRVIAPFNLVPAKEGGDTTENNADETRTV